MMTVNEARSICSILQLDLKVEAQHISMLFCWHTVDVDCLALWL